MGGKRLSAAADFEGEFGNASVEREPNLCESGKEIRNIYLTLTEGILVLSGGMEAGVTHVDEKPSHLKENIDGGED